MGLEQELTDPAAVISALAEFDTLGREAFLEKYGFGHAYKYWIERDGHRYDAKAVIGAARGFQYPERGPLRSEEFSSSERAVRDLLEGIGFTVTSTSSEATSPKALVIYIGEPVNPNFRVGLEKSTWGFKSSDPAYDELRAGDWILFGVRGSGLGTRMDDDKWSETVLSEVVVGRLAGPIFEDRTPLWPDEGAEVSYPFRLEFEKLGSRDDVPLKPGLLGPMLSKR